LEKEKMREKNSRTRQVMLVTRAEAAALLAMERSTLIRLQSEGRIAAVKFRPKGRAYYRLADVEALVAEAEARAVR
jgi:hypothetical protein